MILVRMPGPGGASGLYAMEWSRWLKLSESDRRKFGRNSHWEQDEYWMAQGRPMPGTAAYRRVRTAWSRLGKTVWQPLGYGHHFERGEANCSPYVYWRQRRFDIDAQLNRGPRQRDGSVIAELYGYKLARRDPLPAGEFVVLRYHICRGPVRADGTCP